MTINRRYTFKLYPNKVQELDLERCCRVSAMIWNAALEQREMNHHLRKTYAGHADLKPETAFNQSKAIKFLKKEIPEFGIVNSSILEAALQRLHKAFDAFYRNLKSGKSYKESGYPKYRLVKYEGSDWNSRHSATFDLRDQPTGFQVLNKSDKGIVFKFKGMTGSIKSRGTFPCDVEIRTATIFRKEGSWWVSFSTRQETRIKSGNRSVKVEYDLIDDFAKVKYSGQCVSFEAAFLDKTATRIPPNSKGYITSGADTLGNRGERKFYRHENPPGLGADTPPDKEFKYTGQCMPFEDGFSKNPLTRIHPKTNGYEDIGSTDPENLGEPYGACGWDLLKRCSTNPENLLAKASQLQESIDQRLKENDLRREKGSKRWKKERNLISKLQGKLARLRKDILHNQTSKIINNSKSIEVITPEIAKEIESGKGNKKEWGAEVKTIAKLNRSILSKAPSMCTAMLEYKASEAGIDFTKVSADNHQIKIGKSLKKSGQANRKAKSKLKKLEKEMT